MPRGRPKSLDISKACAPDAWYVIASNQGSKGRSPSPGVQGAGQPLAAARAGQLLDGRYGGKQPDLLALSHFNPGTKWCKSVIVGYRINSVTRHFR